MLISLETGRSTEPLMVVEIMLSEQKKDRFLSIAQKPFKHQISPQAQKYGAGRL